MATRTLLKIIEHLKSKQAFSIDNTVGKIAQQNENKSGT
jgi:hypothetical protein